MIHDLRASRPGVSRFGIRPRAGAPSPAGAPPPARPAQDGPGRTPGLGRRLLAELAADECPLDVDRRGRRRILRQPLVNRLVHWLVALSTFSLFFSGFGQLPLYKRYMLSDLPGLAWTADYSATLLMHYLGAGVLMFAVVFHLAYHGLLRRACGLWPRRGDLRESAQIIRAMLTGGAEPPSAKYLAEQRLAYVAIGVPLLLVILTGVVKVLKNLPGVALPEVAIAAATHLHNLAAILLLLGVVGHLVALVIPANQKLVGGMFHGMVDHAYVEHRHPIWFQELTGRSAAPPPEPGAAEGTNADGTGPAPADRPAIGAGSGGAPR